MNKSILSLSFFSWIFLFSCKKDVGIKTINIDPTPVPIISKGYFPLAIGNYWVYEKYTTDTSGNMIGGVSIDTMKITGDTTINGYTFYKLFGSASIPSYDRYQFLRDSSGYIVYSEGGKFNPTNFTDTIGIDTTLQYIAYAMMEHKDSSIITPAGVYKTNALTCKKYFFNSIMSGNNPYVDYTFYASNIGIVKQTWWWGNMLWTETGKLISYKIN